MIKSGELKEISVNYPEMVKNLEQCAIRSSKRILSKEEISALYYMLKKNKMSIEKLAKMFKTKNTRMGEIVRYLRSLKNINNIDLIQEAVNER